MTKFLSAVGIFACCTLGYAQQNETKFPLSPSLVSGKHLYISGQVGINSATGKLANSSFEDETRQVMANLENQLKAHNLTFDDLVSTIIYIKDMKQYESLNKVYGSFFKKRFPTRTCIAVADLPVGASVEISGIAEIKKSKK